MIQLPCLMVTRLRKRDADPIMQSILIKKHWHLLLRLVLLISLLGAAVTRRRSCVGLPPPSTW